MRESDIALIIITVLLGIVVFWSYYSQLVEKGKSIYDNKYWIGINKCTIQFIIPFMLLAALGFLTFFVGYLVKPPEKGLLSYWNGWVTFILMLVFLLSSIWWSYAVNRALKTDAKCAPKIYTSVSLILAAIAVILMLGGSFESDNLVLIVGMLFLAIQVVLMDGIGWNAKFILKELNKN